MIRAINTVATPTGHTIYVACDLQGVGHSLWRCHYHDLEDRYSMWFKCDMPMQAPADIKEPPVPIDLRFSAEELIHKVSALIKSGFPTPVEFTTHKDLKIESTQISGDGKCKMSFAEGGFNERSVMVDVEDKNDWVDDLNTGDELRYIGDGDHWLTKNAVLRVSEMTNDDIYFTNGVKRRKEYVLKNFKRIKKEDSFILPFHILKPLTRKLLEELFAKIKKPSQKISFATGKYHNSCIDFLNAVHHRGVEISGCIISSLKCDKSSIDITVNKIIKEEPTEDTDEDLLTTENNDPENGDACYIGKKFVGLFVGLKPEAGSYVLIQNGEFKCYHNHQIKFKKA